MNPTCFLIDDDEDDKEIFQVALSEINTSLTCMSAKDGVEAISILSNRSILPGHIFLDINMPLMSGNECLIALRKLKHLEKVPIYIYSTSGGDMVEDFYTRHGAQKVLAKPARMAELIALLKDIVAVTAISPASPETEYQPSH